MPNAVLLSVQPMWCEKIASGRKTLELRKSKPNLPLPFRCYIYQTRLRWVFKLLRSLGMDALADTLTIGSGKVIGEFTCDYILGHCEMANADIAEQQSCVRREDIFQYSGGKEVYGWHISDLVIYDEPKPLRSFSRPCPYELPDGARKNVPCPCDKFTWGFDEHTGLSYCTRRLERAPQSWCYVENQDKKV